ncbi:MAG: hypothetical protein DHS20C15_01530 [Planctomycetota bacterium]|nr:MAG: hypothetical protein DHS20C15_01530 [Planctomycetota bacterium]
MMNEDQVMDAAETLAFVDMGALIVLLSLGVLGAIKGAVRIVIGLVSLSVGVVLAGRFGGELNAESWPVITGFDDPQRVGGLVGCALVFVVAIVLGALLAKFVRKAVEDSNLGGMDRLIGLLLGFAQGALWVSLLVVGAKALAVPSLDAELEDSQALRGTRELVLVTRGFASSGKIRDFLDATLDLPTED